MVNILYMSIHQYSFSFNRRKITDSAYRNISYTKYINRKIYYIAFFIIIFYILQALEIVHCTTILMLFISLLLSSILFINIIKSLILYQAKYYNNSSNKTVTQAETNIPTVTAIIALYQEADVLPQLINALNHLIYKNLEIAFLLEQDDSNTQKILLSLISSLQHKYRIIIVPCTAPRTKAKACNYAMQIIHSEYIVIFDAEDIPDHTQIMEVINILNHHPQHYAQCKLAIYNRNHHILAHCFAVEYYFLFNLVLPFCARYDIPFPLGGSSNYLPYNMLCKLKYWDSYNVTEDAEIGFAAALSGMKGIVIDSYTYEEAPEKITVWLKQRRRWFKGYMQTLLSLINKAPYKMRYKQYFGIYYFLLLPTISYVLLPILSLLYIIICFKANHDISKFTTIFMTFNIIFSCLLNIIQHYRFVVYHKQQNKWHYNICYILYYTLHVIAAIQSCIDLIYKPYYWHKTPHHKQHKRQSKIHYQNK